MKDKKILTALKIISSISVLLIALIFIFLFYNIYLNGSSPNNISANGVLIEDIYSREIIAASLKPYLPILIVLLILVFIATLVNSFYFVTENKNNITNANKLRLIKNRVDSLPVDAIKEEKKRIYINVASYTSLICCLISALIYLMNIDNFISWELEGVMFSLLINLLPELILAFIIMLIKLSLLDKSFDKEFEILSKCEKKSNVNLPSVDTERKLTVSIMLFSIALLFILIGIINGGMKDVLIKAINICTECIGLG